MCPIQNEDYLMRQARAVAAMLARILGLRTDGQLDEARAELAGAYALLTGQQGGLLRHLEAPAAVEALGSAERALVFAELHAAEAELAPDPQAEAALRQHALALAQAARDHYGASEPIESFVANLAKRIRGESDDAR